MDSEMMANFSRLQIKSMACQRPNIAATQTFCRFCRMGAEKPQLPLQVYEDKGPCQVIYPKHIDAPSSKFCSTCL
ncbi:hypothetical protein CY35_08G136400 [Sphagnum magellanicum]|nr:hypothetical protein CY35_08G136400 [Sphagnum magellanicum]